MSAPRLDVRLDHLAANTRTLAERLGARGIAVCAVTKATLGSPEVARVALGSGAHSLGESRIESIERLRHAGVAAEIVLIRSPMMNQVERVVAHADVSLNTELDVVDRLSLAANGQRRRHGVVLMVELGDLREGILPADLPRVVGEVLTFPGIDLRGIGTNLACHSGVVPDDTNMDELSALATSVEHAFGIHLDIVSGGNSANLDWALDPASSIGRVNHLRLGEAILLGREPLHRSAITGLHTDAITLVGEVIESKDKPRCPTGRLAQNAFGEASTAGETRTAGHTGTVGDAGAEGASGAICSPDTAADGSSRRVIVALGRQDVDPAGLTPPAGFTILGASSDHLLLEQRPESEPCEVGDELRFDVDYAALLRAMTSPFVEREYVRGPA